MSGRPRKSKTAGVGGRDAPDDRNVPDYQVDPLPSLPLPCPKACVHLRSHSPHLSLILDPNSNTYPTPPPYLSPSPVQTCTLHFLLRRHTRRRRPLRTCISYLPVKARLVLLFALSDAEDGLQPGVQHLADLSYGRKALHSTRVHRQKRRDN